MTTRRMRPAASLSFMGLLLLINLPLISCGGGGGAGGNQHVLQADVSFPPSQTATQVSEIRVVGTTPAGADAVMVAGLSATSTDGFLNWKCDVPLASGWNDIEVKVRSGTAEVLAKTLRVERAPQLVPEISALARGINGDLVYYGSDPLRLVRQTAHGDRDYLNLPAGPAADDFVYDSQRNIIVKASGLTFTIIDTISQTVIATVDAPTLLPADMALDETTGEVFVTAYDLTALLNSTIVRLDPQTATLTTVSANGNSVPPSDNSFDFIDFDSINDFLVAWDPALKALIKINTSTGLRTSVASNILLNGHVISLAMRDGLDEVELLTDSGERHRINLTSGLGTSQPVPVFSTPVTNDTSANNIRAADYVSLVYESAGAMLLVRSDRVVRLLPDGSHEEVLQVSHGEQQDVRSENFFYLTWDSLRDRLVTTNGFGLLAVDVESGDLLQLAAPASGYFGFIRPIRYDPSRDLIYYISGLTNNDPAAVVATPAIGGDVSVLMPIPEGLQARDVDYDPATGEYLVALQGSTTGPLDLTLRRSMSDGTPIFEYQSTGDPMLTTTQFFVHAPSNSFFGRQVPTGQLFRITAPANVVAPFAPVAPLSPSSPVAANLDELRNEYVIVEDGRLRIFDLATSQVRELNFTAGNLMLTPSSGVANFCSLARDPKTGLIYLASRHDQLIVVVEPESLTWTYIHY